MHQGNIATRAMHKPVIRYHVDAGEPEETRVGNTGIYYSFLNRDEVPEASEDTCEEIHTGIAKLGAVPQVNRERFDFTVFQVINSQDESFFRQHTMNSHRRCVFLFLRSPDFQERHLIYSLEHLRLVTTALSHSRATLSKMVLRLVYSTAE